MADQQTAERRRRARQSTEQNKQPAENSESGAAAAGDNTQTLSFKYLGKTASIGGPSTVLAYPSNLNTPGGLKDQTDYVRFQFKKYKPPFSTSSSNRGSYGGYNASAIELEDDPSLPTVCLYMPEDIQTAYGTQWGGRAIQNVTASVLQSISGKPSLAAMAEDISSLAGTAVDGLDIAVTKKILEALQTTGQGEGLNINDVLGSTRGVVVNPNTELLFQGFDLRTFNLQFKMVARNGTEAENIKNIVTTFKQAMLPSLNETGGFSDGKQTGSGIDRTSFIGIPDIVDVRFMLGGDEHPYLTQFKPCAISGLQVNYTPDGSYATYKNGEPVAISMNLQFSETKLVYREDIRYGGASF